MRLAARISLLVIALALSLSALNAWLLGQHLNDRLTADQERLIRTLTQGIGEASARAVLSRNVLAGRETLRNIVKVSPDIDYAYIIDFDGRVFADSFDHGFPSALMRLKHVHQGELRRAVFRDDRHLISDVAYPLVSGLDAELHLGFILDRTQHSIARGQRELLFIAGAIALPGVLIALWFGRQLSRPLNELREQMQAYGGGTLVEPQPIATGDADVRALWGAFRDMVRERHGLDERLRNSERYNRMLFETSPTGLALARMDGQLVDANTAYANIIGRTVDETLELSYWEITPDEFKHRESVTLAKLRKYGRYGPFEKEYLHKDGHRVPVRLNGLLIEREGEQFIWSSVEDISAERAADERQRMLSAILEASPDFAGTATLDGRIVYVNRGGRRMIGLRDNDDPDDLDGRGIASLHPDWAFRVIAERGIPTALRDGAWRGEAALLTRDGDEVPVAMSIVAHADLNDEPSLLSVIMSDISELKAKEQELLAHRRHLEQLVKTRTDEIRQQARIIAQTHDAIITCALDGTITSWNDGAEQLFGRTSGQTLGRHLKLVFPPEEHDQVAVLIRTLREQGNLESEPTLIREDGSRLHGHISFSLLYDEAQLATGLVAYAQDITERKLAEAELVSLATDLSVANKELESFTYSVSHDLRAPLRALDGFSLALLEDYGDRLDDTARNYLDRVRSAAQQMGRLIDDLLQLSRMTRSALEKQDVDLSDLATKAVEQLRTLDPQRQAEVWIEPGMQAHGDPGMLRVVLDNLLGNAWKYTAKREHAEIRFRQRSDVDGKVFVVEDNGAGFNMAYANKLFGPFQRLHHSDEFPGTGVGLATVARIIHRHEGKVWGESEEGKGATFYFRLPDRTRAAEHSMQTQNRE